jgi:hypothetical protein
MPYVNPGLPWITIEKWKQPGEVDKVDDASLDQVMRRERG